MRWYYKPKGTPVPWCKRTITKFLWIPLTIGYETRWLETVVIEQQYCDYHKIGYASEWENIKFINP